MKRVLLFALVICCTSLSVHGATATPTPSSTPNTGATPKPYSPNEFSPVLNKIRRFEVISLGVFPLAFIAAGLLYDVGRWGVKAAKSQSDGYLYAPLFFAPSNKPSQTQDDLWAILGIGLGIGVAVGTLDIVIENARPTPKPSSTPFWAEVAPGDVTPLPELSGKASSTPGPSQTPAPSTNK